MCKIERILRRGASTPHTGYDKDKVEGHRLEIQEILSTLRLASRVRPIFHQRTLIGIAGVPQRRDLWSLLCGLDNLFYRRVPGEPP